eukprot:363471-Chlamydomonas_euryale.AAC.3
MRARRRNGRVHRPPHPPRLAPQLPARARAARGSHARISLRSRPGDLCCRIARARRRTPPRDPRRTAPQYSEPATRLPLPPPRAMRASRLPARGNAESKLSSRPWSPRQTAPHRAAAGASVSGAFQRLSTSSCRTRETAQVGQRGQAPQRRIGAQGRRLVVPMASVAPETSLGQTWTLPNRSLMVTSITATTVASFMQEMDQAATTGVDILELRLDFIKDYDTERDLRKIMKHAKLPYIVTYRPTWEWCAADAPCQLHGIQR